MRSIHIHHILLVYLSTLATHKKFSSFRHCSLTSACFMLVCVLRPIAILIHHNKAVTKGYLLTGSHNPLGSVLSFVEICAFGEGFKGERLNNVSLLL